MEKLAGIIKYCIEQKPVKPLNYIFKIFENGFVDPSAKTVKKCRDSLLNQYADVDYDEFENKILAN